MAPPLPSPIFFPPKQVTVFFNSSDSDDHEHGTTTIPPPVPQYRRSKTYDLNSKIMLASIVSLSVVVVLVTLLHIYARWLLRRQGRRRAAMHALGLVGTANNYSEPPRKTGLDPSVIASLPTFVFRQPDPAAETETAVTVSECAVCLSVLEDEEVVRLLPNCKHTFHVECIDKWFALHMTCPICRAEAWPVNQPDQLSGLPAVPPPTAAPALERAGSVASLCVEGTSSDGAAVNSHHHKQSGSITSLSSFRRILSRERSSRRIQPEEESTQDLERQQ